MTQATDGADIISSRLARALLPATTVVLVAIIIFLVVFLLPWYLAVLTSLGVAAPLPARVALGVLSSGLVPLLFVAALLTYAWWRQPAVRARMPLGTIPWRTLLHATNLLLLIAVMSLGSTFVGFIYASQPVLQKGLSAPHAIETPVP